MILWRLSKDHTQDMESLMDAHRQVGWLKTITHYCEDIMREQHLEFNSLSFLSFSPLMLLWLSNGPGRLANQNATHSYWPTWAR